ncbi:Restriction endonuclease S subunit [Candidatus Accumulibacter aalborgensis]|uniref:Restriction endonuclease S subunit n=1 Tax=Candidatus Accumulibacter aalborgensis TaxID=1860102 RepID=A0A1A8XMS6_9PROT|nr:restriction endonuclease subunit S [Candidatus Accumulibacter aalborgensis]SBT06460.1 Restriction endonuclease S subunit [Candidatus Accumulibacter aalborgensis]
MIADLKPYAEYKESGLLWSPIIPAHWHEERAKRLFTKMERPVRDDDGVVTCFRDGMVTLRKNRRLAGFTEAIYELGYQGIRRGDLVIHAMDAFAGAVGVSDSDGKATPVYAVCQARSGANAYYYAFIVREMARSQWILALSRGIRERSTDFRYAAFGGQRVPFPPPEEQAAIVRFLDWATGRLERTIRAKRKVIALLNEQKQAIIHRAVTRGLDPSVFLKPTGTPWLGDIPQHWEVWRVSHFARVGNGSTPSRANPGYWTKGVCPWLNSSQVNRGFIDSADQFVTAAALRECHLPKVAAGSVLVAITGQGKTRGMSAVLGFEATINQHIAFITPRVPITTAAFLHLALTAAYLQLRASSEDAGSTKGAITCEDLKRFKLAIPPLPEQDELLARIQAETRTLTHAISRLAREIELLREYRTRLVADVVTGKLDVREAAAKLPDEAQSETADEAVDFGDEAEIIDEEIAA